MGFFKAEGLISGWVGKIRNNLYFRITRQSSGKNNFNFKILTMIEIIRNLPKQIKESFDNSSYFG